MINLVDELRKAYNGNAWHGNNMLKLLLKANAEKVFTHPVPNAHSIAELVLHLTAWTEEVMKRVNGESAKTPSQGDWPMPVEKSAEEWQKIMSDFKLANEKLIELVNGFVSSNWSSEVNDKRGPAFGRQINNAQLLNGLIQHHAYHSGQIALLLKF